MTKYKAIEWKDRDGFTHYGVERTHPVYGFPAVEIPQQPRFHSLKEAQDFARHLNEDAEQLKLF